MKNLKKYTVTFQKKGTAPRESSSIKFNELEKCSLLCTNVKITYRNSYTIDAYTIDAYIKPYHFSFNTKLCQIHSESKSITFTFSNEIAITFCKRNTELNITFDKTHNHLNETVKYVLKHHEKLESKSQFFQNHYVPYIDDTLEDCLKLHILAMRYVCLENQTYRKNIRNILCEVSLVAKGFR
jgi:hypothetical protein